MPRKMGPVVRAWENFEVQDQAYEFVCRRGAEPKLIEQTRESWASADAALSETEPETPECVLVKLRLLARHLKPAVDGGEILCHERMLADVESIERWLEPQADPHWLARWRESVADWEG